MRTTLTLLLALVMSATTFAAGPGLIITDSGYTVVTVGADGKPVQNAVTQVMDLRSGGNPQPGPQPPVTGDAIADQVAAWAKDVGDPTSAQALVIVYREVGKIASGQPRDKVLQALRQGSDTVLSTTGGTEKWRGWRGKVSALIDAEEAKGTVDYSKLCNSIATGLERSAPSAALDPALLTLIINAILQILQIIFGNIGGGGGV